MHVYGLYGINHKCNYCETNLLYLACKMDIFTK